jgi:hypothetical protein
METQVVYLGRKIKMLSSDLADRALVIAREGKEPSYNTIQDENLLYMHEYLFGFLCQKIELIIIPTPES